MFFYLFHIVEDFDPVATVAGFSGFVNPNTLLLIALEEASVVSLLLEVGGQTYHVGFRYDLIKSFACLETILAKVNEQT